MFDRVSSGLELLGYGLLVAGFATGLVAMVVAESFGDLRWAVGMILAGAVMGVALFGAARVVDWKTDRSHGPRALPR